MAEGREAAIVWQQQQRSVCCGLLTGVWLVSAVIVARRISDNASSLPEWAACLVGLVAMVVTILCVTRPEIGGRLNRTHSYLLLSMATIPAVVLGLALLPTDSTTGMASLLGLFVVNVLAASVATTDANPNSDRDQIREPAAPFANDAVCESDAETNPESVPSPPPSDQPLSLLSQTEIDDRAAGDGWSQDSGPGESTIHRMSRSVADGYDTIEGNVRVGFEPDSRQTAVHLSFVPAFATTPELDTEPIDDSDVRVRVTALHPYGARFDVIRSEAIKEAGEIELAYAVFAPSAAHVA